MGLNFLPVWTSYDGVQRHLDDRLTQSPGTQGVMEEVMLPTLTWTQLGLYKKNTYKSYDSMIPKSFASPGVSDHPIPRPRTLYVGKSMSNIHHQRLTFSPHQGPWIPFLGIQPKRKTVPCPWSSVPTRASSCPFARASVSLGIDVERPL